MGMEKRTTKAAQREATTRQLIQVGRMLFTRNGYAQTPTEDIVQQANVTRGALYHHFASKEGLFRAVLDGVQKDVVGRIEEAASQTEDLWQQLLLGCRAFLTACLDADVQQIMLIDAPAVLGWDVWRQMDADYSMKSLKENLTMLTRNGLITPLPVDALTHLLSGAMNEAALWIARSEQPQQALADAIITLEHLLMTLRVEQNT